MRASLRSQPHRSRGSSLSRPPSCQPAALVALLPAHDEEAALPAALASLAAQTRPPGPGRGGRGQLHGPDRGRGPCRGRRGVPHGRQHAQEGGGAEPGPGRVAARAGRRGPGAGDGCRLAARSRVPGGGAGPAGGQRSAAPPSPPGVGGCGWDVPGWPRWGTGRDVPAQRVRPVRPRRAPAPGQGPGADRDRVGVPGPGAARGAAGPGRRRAPRQVGRRRRLRHPRADRGQRAVAGADAPRVPHPRAGGVHAGDRGDGLLVGPGPAAGAVEARRGREPRRLSASPGSPRPTGVARPLPPWGCSRRSSTSPAWGGGWPPG